MTDTQYRKTAEEKININWFDFSWRTSTAWRTMWGQSTIQRGATEPLAFISSTTCPHSRSRSRRTGIHLSLKKNDKQKVPSPMCRPGFIQFLVRLCAGVGGLVATSAIVSNLVKNLVDFYCCKRWKSLLPSFLWTLTCLILGGQKTTWHPCITKKSKES